MPLIFQGSSSFDGPQGDAGNVGARVGKIMNHA